MGMNSSTSEGSPSAPKTVAPDQPHLTGPLQPGIDLSDIHLTIEATLAIKEDLIRAKQRALETLSQLSGGSLVMNTGKVVQAMADLLQAQIANDRMDLAAQYAGVNHQIAEQIREAMLVQVPGMDSSTGTRGSRR